MINSNQHILHTFRWWPGACLSLLANNPKDHSQHHDTGGRQNNHCHQSSSVHNVNIAITFVVVIAIITVTIRCSPHECTPARAFPFLSLASHRFVISPKYLFQFEMVKMSLTLLFHTNKQMASIVTKSTFPTKITPAGENKRSQRRHDSCRL